MATSNNSSELLINEQIRAKEVRLIDSDGSQLGIVDIVSARKRAEEQDLDLVMMSQQEPPVCKIMDYSKYRYEKNKRERDQKKNQTVTEMKEIRLTPAIDVHDLEVKAKATIKFLQSGNKVKVAVRFRGRQIAHSNIGMDVLNAFLELVSEYAVIDKPAKQEGKNLFMVLMPKPTK